MLQAFEVNFYSDSQKIRRKVKMKKTLYFYSPPTLLASARIEEQNLFLYESLKYQSGTDRDYTVRLFSFAFDQEESTEIELLMFDKDGKAIKKESI
jgi:hypothetical protein